MTEADLTGSEHPGATPTTQPAPAAPPAAHTAPATITVAAPEPATVATGVIAGLVAAAIGAAIWTVLVVQTGYEVGFAAVGIGYLAGEGVLIGARHARGVSLQVAAVVCAALGVVLGKYATFEHVLHETVNSQYGSAEAARVSLLSSDVMRTFWDSRSDVFSGFDLLWVGFAVVTAWKIPSVARGLATR